MVNLENNDALSDSVTRPAFGYILNSLSFMFMFNSCLNMNTRTFYVALTIILLLKYLFNYGIKLCHLITYYLTIQKPYIDDGMIPIASFAN
jgi:hypothetical protein